jgi:hypothetical protein
MVAEVVPPIEIKEIVVNPEADTSGTGLVFDPKGAITGAASDDTVVGTTNEIESGPVSAPPTLLSAGTMAVPQFPTGPVIPYPAILMSWESSSIATLALCWVCAV